MRIGRILQRRGGRSWREEHKGPVRQEGLRYGEQVATQPSDGWVDASPFLMTRREKRMGVPTGKVEVLVLASGGISCPDD